jgi:foldase protein PrsA
MKDKLKGLIIGILIGVLLSGSIAYAGGVSAEVLLKRFKIMVNGVEKQPKEHTLLYNNRVYIPIRFVGELMGESVKWDGKTGTIWIGGKGGLEIVATYQDKEVLKKQLDSYLLVTKFFNPQYEEYEKDVAYVEFMLKQLIGYSILSNRADQTARDEAKTKTDLEMEQIKLNVNASTKSPDGFANKMLELNLVESDIYHYLLNIFTGQAAIKQQITDEQIKAKYDTDKDAYTLATVSHILIAFKDQNDQELRSKEEALTRAEEVRIKLDEGSNFAELASVYSDDPGSASNGGTYTNQPVNNWVPEFKKATLELPLNIVSEPVETNFGYHLIRVDDRTVRTLDETTEEIRTQLSGLKLNEFFTNELSGLIQTITIPKLE